MPDRIEELQALEHLREVLDTQFLNVVHREKPDFVICHRGACVGVEVTDASASDFRWALDIARTEKLECFDCSELHNSASEQKRKRSELLELMQTPNCANSEMSAVAWASRVADRIKEKCRLMKENKLTRFEHNWLLVYNVQSNDSVIEATRCRDMLLGALGPDMELRRAFSVIYVLSHSNLIVLDLQQTIARDLKPRA